MTRNDILVDRFFVSLVLDILLLWLLWHWPQMRPHNHKATLTAARERLLKPRTPADCQPVVRRERPRPHILQPRATWRPGASARAGAAHPNGLRPRGLPVPIARVLTIRLQLRTSMLWSVTAHMVSASASRPCAARHAARLSARAVIPRSTASKPPLTGLPKCSPPWRKASPSQLPCGCLGIGRPPSRHG